MKETLKEAAVIYAHKSFIWPLNKKGEKQSIPPGQVVPQGYAKHQKIATKHFTSGAKWQAERSYSDEDMAESFMACWKANVPEGFECKLSFNEWFEQFKKK